MMVPLDKRGRVEHRPLSGVQKVVLGLAIGSLLCGGLSNNITLFKASLAADLQAILFLAVALAAGAWLVLRISGLPRIFALVIVIIASFELWDATTRTWSILEADGYKERK